MNFLVTKAFADTTAAPANTTGAVGATPANALPPGPAAAPSMMGMLPPFAMMLVVFYFLMIRPQQKKQKEQDSMLTSLQKGEEVITRAGIIGRIHGIADKFITLEVDKNVHIKILKNQIEVVVRGEQKA